MLRLAFESNSLTHIQSIENYSSLQLFEFVKFYNFQRMNDLVSEACHVRESCAPHEDNEKINKFCNENTKATVEVRLLAKALS